jgi:hypothetical protein
VPQEAAEAACAQYPLTWEAEALFARSSAGHELSDENVLVDAAAHGRLARYSDEFGTVVGYGPYAALAYGRYRVRFWLRSSEVVATRPVAQLSVRSDYADWRLRQSEAEFRPANPGDPDYQSVAIDFLHAGEGSVSVTVTALIGRPLWFDRVEVENVDCP